MYEKEALAAVEQVLEAQDLCNLLKQEEGLQTQNNTWKLGSSVDLLKYVEYIPICQALICPAEFLSFAFSFSASNNGCSSSERRSEMLPSWLATARAWLYMPLQTLVNDHALVMLMLMMKIANLSL